MCQPFFVFASPINTDVVLPRTIVGVGDSDAGVTDINVGDSRVNVGDADSVVGDFRINVGDSDSVVGDSDSGVGDCTNRADFLNSGVFAINLDVFGVGVVGNGVNQGFFAAVRWRRHSILICAKDFHHRFVAISTRNIQRALAVRIFSGVNIRTVGD